MSRADAVLGSALFVAALLLGTWYVPQVVAAGGRPHFYQEQFGPAVMVACGHGYVNPQQPTPDLDAFLALHDATRSAARRRWRPSAARRSPRCSAPIAT